MDAATALIVVDVQQAFDDAGYWGRRNNPGCEANVARLIEAWRAEGRPLVFVRHDSDEEVSPLRPDEPGNAFKPEVSGEPDLLVTKQVNSAFSARPTSTRGCASAGSRRSRCAASPPTTAWRPPRGWAATSATTCCSCSTPARRSTARGRTGRS